MRCFVHLKANLACRRHEVFGRLGRLRGERSKDGKSTEQGFASELANERLAMTVTIWNVLSMTVSQDWYAGAFGLL